MKRFYKSVAVVAAEGRHAIHLDEKPVMTPMGRALALPSVAFAEAVAEEWRTQAEIIRPVTMVLTAIANTAIDRIAVDRTLAVAQLARYAETDLLCYRADAPADLVARQAAAWQPVLDWAEACHGAALLVTAGVTPVAQPEAALDALRRALHAHDEFRLAALSTAVSAMGSLILSLALADGRLSATEAFALAQLDETYQNEKWGEDDEAVAHRAEVRSDVAAAALVFRLHSA